MNNAKILIEATPSQQAEIEEHCLKYGFSISQYFLELHAKNILGVKSEDKEITPRKRKVAN